MANRKGKVKLQKSDSIVLRSISQLSDGMAVIATDTPIEKWDDRTQQVVKEVLLMEGCRFRGGRDKIPIVDSHDDSTVGNVLGSIQRMQVNTVTGELCGYQSWASTEDAQDAATLVNEGHVTDFSITAQPMETIFVQRGQTYTTPRGMIIEGPAIIHTEWEPHNASICATGADVNSVVRRSYTDLKRKVLRMDEALLAQASALGLPDGMTDPNQVLAWLMGKLGGGSSEPMEPVESMAEPVVPPVEPVVPPVENMAKLDEVIPPKVMNQASTVDQIKRALQADQVRRTEIQAACTLAKVERAFADELCDKLVPLSEARKRIIERMATEPLGASAGGDVRVTRASEDKFIAAARDGIVARSKGRTSIQRSLYVGGDKPAEGHEEFKNLNLIRMATLFGERAGLPVQRMNNPEIARALMRMSTLQGAYEVSQRYRIQRADFDAYHTTGSFANLLLDASNKTLLAGYEEAPYTWNMWARQANSVDDFKNINRTRFSEAPNPEEVPERADYPEKAMSDSKETYRVAKYGESFSVSWETIVNDDLDALSRIPAMHGNAMRRFQNRKVYEVLTSNPLMGDGFNLFSSSHASGDNTSGAAAAPSVTTLNAAFVKMMTQKGLTSDAVISVVPKFVIVPVAYSATLLQLIASLSDPNAGGSSAGNANTLNIYGPNGMRPITPIIEPQLDASSATDWYVAADNAQIDTVELSFLSGEESPVIDSEYNMKNDTYYNKIRQTFGTKAIDWRGLFRNKA